MRNRGEIRGQRHRHNSSSLSSLTVSSQTFDNGISKKALVYFRAINKVFIRIAGYFLVALISSIIVSASALFFTQLLPLIDYRCSSRLWHNIHWSIGFALSWHCGVNYWSTVLTCPGKLYPLPELQRQEQLHRKTDSSSYIVEKNK